MKIEIRDSKDVAVAGLGPLAPVVHVDGALDVFRVEGWGEGITPTLHRGSLCPSPGFFCRLVRSKLSEVVTGDSGLKGQHSLAQPAELGRHGPSSLTSVRPERLRYLGDGIGHEGIEPFQGAALERWCGPANPALLAGLRNRGPSARRSARLKSKKHLSESPSLNSMAVLPSPPPAEEVFGSIREVAGRGFKPSPAPKARAIPA